MSACHIQAEGLVELYFYDELPSTERAEVARHLPSCAECRAALDELHLISATLADRPVVSAPPGSDWSALMARIDRTVAVEPARPLLAAIPSSTLRPARRPIAALVATAAVVTLVSAALVYQGLERRRPGTGPAPVVASAGGAAQPIEAAAAPAEASPAPAEAIAAARPDTGFAAVSEEHFERSKLVILGLTTRNARSVSPSDWAYERQLAGALLDDTRLYKQAAQARGLGTLAGVMSDLELVLLQTSLTAEPDAATLNRLQRLIRQRDLVAKMEVSKWF